MPHNTNEFSVNQYFKLLGRPVSNLMIWDQRMQQFSIDLKHGLLAKYMVILSDKQFSNG
jgi:hypothetical protein